MEDSMSEAEHLSEMYDDYFVSAEEFVHDVRQELKRDAVVYAVNKKRKVGESCQCAGPKCNKTFTKKSYQQAFCRGKCKDQFWNRVRFWKNDAKVEMLMEKIDYINHGEPEYYEG
jgi:hypothetical protein